MKSSFFKLVFTLTLFLSLTACSSQELFGIATFIRHYGADLSLRDFCYEEGQEENFWYTFIDEKENTLMLKAVEDSQSYLSQVRIYMNKHNASGEKITPSPSQTKLFYDVSLRSAAAFTCLDISRAGEILDALFLKDGTCHSKEGELSVEEEGFYFLYISTAYASELIIFNTLLTEPVRPMRPDRGSYGRDTFITRQEGDRE